MVHKRRGGEGTLGDKWEIISAEMSWRLLIMELSHCRRRHVAAIVVTALSPRESLGG